MTLIARLWLMLAISLAGFFVLGGVGYNGFTTMMHESKLVEEKETAGVYLYQNTALSLANTQRAVRNLLMLHENNDKFTSYVNRVKQGHQTVQEQFELAAATMYSEKGQAINDAIAKNLADYIKADEVLLAEVSKLRELAQSRDTQRILPNEFEALYALADSQQSVFRELEKSVLAGAELKIARTKESSARVQETSAFITTVFVIVLLIALLALLVISMLSIAKIKRAMSSFSQGVKQLTAGNFSYRFNTQGKDEFVTLGVELNSLSQSLDQSISEANLVVGAIATGDFSQRMNGNYAGSLNSLKSSVNTSIANIDSVMNSLQAAMQALKQGQFGFNVQTNAPGSYGLMLTSVADSMKVLSLVVADINQIMQRLNDGNFDARVNADAEGDLLQMKQSVNSSLNTLEHLVEDLVRMAQAQMEGDLTVVSQGTYKGRFKELQDARAASTARIQEVVGVALQASHTVSGAAAQVSQGSHDLSSRVQQQASALEQTSATMHQMTDAVQANTENAEKAAKLAQLVQGQSVEGVQVMQQTIDAMRAIQQSSNQIADIVSIIDSIAFQTNLLALNAAVEAARAGEHGRGFAVVAGEVRALAGKSAEAAKDIKTLIEDSVQRIDIGTKLADKSGDMLSAISGSVKEVAGMIEAISFASKEQANSISQVHLAVANIDRVTQENAALVEETTAAAESLNHEANELRQNISFFKTGQATQSAARITASTNKTPSRSGTKALSSVKNHSSPDEWSEF